MRAGRGARGGGAHLRIEGGARGGGGGECRPAHAPGRRARQAAPSPVKACRTPAEMPFVVAGQDHRGQVAASCPLWGPAPVQGGAERVGEVAMVVSATASPTPWFPGGGGDGAAGSDSDAGSRMS